MSNGDNYGDRLEEALLDLSGRGHEEAEVYIAYGLYHGLEAEALEDWHVECEDMYQGFYLDNVSFAQQMADGIDPAERIGWPYNKIDWVEAADELMQDYFETEGHYYAEC